MISAHSMDVKIEVEACPSIALACTKRLGYVGLVSLSGGKLFKPVGAQDRRWAPCLSHAAT